MTASSGRMNGKVVIVTGATRGMGEAIARACVVEGGQTALCGRDRDAGEAIARDLGAKAIYVEMDVGVEADWVRAIKQTMEAFGKISGLVNNAGTPEGSAIEEIDPHVADRIYRVNQLGPLLGMKHVTAPMRAAGGGSIVNIGSVSFEKGIARQTIYGATKGAVVGMTRSASIELAPDRIRVNVLHPGFFDTRLLDEATGGTGMAMGEQLVPLGRTAAPSEIAAAATFLLSDESGYITGAELRVDGGFGIC